MPRKLVETGTAHRLTISIAFSSLRCFYTAFTLATDAAEYEELLAIATE